MGCQFEADHGLSRLVKGCQFKADNLELMSNSEDRERLINVRLIIGCQ